MKQSGFTIVELIVVIAIVAVLSTFATMAFRDMSRKQEVNDQIREIYADLAQARSDSLYQRRQRRVELSGTSFAMYSSLVSGAGVNPLMAKTMLYPIKNRTTTSVTFDFDVGGLLMGVESASVCVNPPADYGTVVDSIVVFTTRTTYGSWENATGDCKRENIDLK